MGDDFFLILFFLGDERILRGLKPGLLRVCKRPGQQKAVLLERV